jgi:O-antigen/teichoic acid export membrane protein
MSDKYLMRFLLGKETMALYSASYKFGSLLLLLVIAFRTAWQPFFLRIAKEEENPQRIYARVLTYFFLIGSFIVVTGSYFVEYIVKLPLGGGRTLLGHAYWGGIIIIPLILTAYLFYGLYVNFTVGIYIKKKTQWMVLFTGLAAVANVGSNFYLMPRFGIMGAAVATLLSYVIMTLAIWIVNQRLYPVRYEYGRLFIILIYLTGMLFVLYYFNPGFGLRVVLILLSPALFLAGGFLKKEELQVLKRWRK